MTPESHRLFAAALTDPDASLPPVVTGSSGAVPLRRFAVYRNNVVASLIEALKARFPASRRIVGDEFFTAAAKVFIGRHPPRSPVMLAYGEAFPAFLRAFPPARSTPYLADVAEVEFALGRAYHAADAKPMPADVLLDLPPDDLQGVRLRLHPSLFIVCSAHPVVTLWRMNLPGRDAYPVPVWAGENAIVSRVADEVAIRVAEAGEVEFLKALGDGLPLGQAAARTASTPGFDPGPAVAALFTHRLVVAATLEPTESLS